MQKQETKTLRVAVFRAPDGSPACLSNVTPSCMCEFIGTRNLGQAYVCMHPKVNDDVRSGTNGYLQPDLKCPLWKGKE